MVKLFVGNLADSVDSHRLKNLFLQYVHVQECDVLKNFAFVHVVTEEDADKVIEKLEKYSLEGREIHIERSTSRLRKEPGMSDKCFTCGACDHKTPNCPYESNKRHKATKRPDESTNEGGTTVGKKARLLSSYLTSQSATSNTPVSGSGDNITGTNNFSQSNTWSYKVGGSSDNDPEMPCPQNPELRTLYEQYLESRTRYFFFRERLGKELRLQQESAAQTTPSIIDSTPIHLGTIDLTKKITSGPPPSSNVVIGNTLVQNYSNLSTQPNSQQPTFSLNNKVSSAQYPAQPATNASSQQLALHYNTNVPANSSLTTAPPQPITRVNLTQNVLPPQHLGAVNSYAVSNRLPHGYPIQQQNTPQLSSVPPYSVGTLAPLQQQTPSIHPPIGIVPGVGVASYSNLQRK